MFSLEENWKTDDGWGEGFGKSKKRSCIVERDWILKKKNIVFVKIFERRNNIITILLIVMFIES